MRTYIVFVLVAVCIFSLCSNTDAWPSDTDKVKDMKGTSTTPKSVKDVNKMKEVKRSKKECVKNCSTIYDPVCAHDPSNPSFKPRTFGSQCIMETVACEMGLKLAVKNKGECPGSDGVRLS